MPNFFTPITPGVSSASDHAVGVPKTVLPVPVKSTCPEMKSCVCPVSVPENSDAL